MFLLRCLVVSLCVYPVMAYTVTPESGVSALEGSTAAPVTSAPSGSPATEAVEARQEALKQRVMAKWDALIRKDFAAAYSFTSPGYRELFSLSAFKGRFGNKVSWQRIEVVNVDWKSDDAATVSIKIHFAYYPPQAERALDMTTHVKESWVRVDGQWWYLVEK